MYIYLIAFVVIILSILFLRYHGVFTKIDISVVEFGPLQYIYKEVLGTDRDLANAYIKLAPIQKKLFPENDNFGIYYDDPKSKYCKNPKKCRSVIGFIIRHDGDENNVLQFMSENPSFKIANLVPIKVLQASRFHFRNVLSYFIAQWKQDSALKKHLKDNYEDYDYKIGRSMEYASVYRKNEKHFIIRFFPIEEQKVTEFYSLFHMNTSTPGNEKEKLN